MQLPLETHIVVSQLCVVFGGALTNEETREVAVRLTTELLFDMSIDRQAEIGFVSFMFVCGESMFVVPEKAAVRRTARRLRGDALTLG